MGKIDAAISAWNAVARTLTGFTGQPRTDLVGSDASVWAHSGRMLDLPIFDSGYAVITAASAAVAGTFGDWVQLSADIGSSKRLVAFHIRLPSNALNTFEIEIGEGGAGSESAVARYTGMINFMTGAGIGSIGPVYVWKSLTSSARISFRARDDQAAALTYGVVLSVA